MKRFPPRTKFLIGTLAVGLISAAAAQAPAQDPLPPVQAPPEMDSTTSTPATIPEPPTSPAPKTNTLSGKDSMPASKSGAAPIVPLANSDAEAEAAAAIEAQASAERAKALASPTLPQASQPLDSPGLPPDVQKAAEATELPVVTVRQQGNERIEEYRKRGKLYFVRAVPSDGPPRYYVDRPSDIPPNMQQLSGPSGVVQPVYFKLVEWK